MDEQPSSSGGDAAPWALLGRETAAGRALFSLYNSENVHGRAAGLRYSQRNRQQAQRQATSRAEAGLAPTGHSQDEHEKAKPKPHVAVPHFRHKGSPTSPTGGVSKLSQLPRRRQGQQIMAEMAAEAEQTRGRVPIPSGRLIDEEEKECCALLMQYRGQLPPGYQSTSAAKTKAAAGSRQQRNDSTLEPAHQGPTGGVSLVSRRHNLQQRFHEVAAEVEEREEFISSMQQLGKLKAEHVNIVRGEVAAKVKEMGELDRQIKDIDTQVKHNSSAGSC